MKIPKFTEDEDKDEINPMERLRLVNGSGRTPSREINYFFDETWEWWLSINKNTRWHCTWE
jgi:hypothetical protein